MVNKQKISRKCKHEWRQKLIKFPGISSMSAGGYYCIHCLKEVETRDDLK